MILVPSETVARLQEKHVIPTPSEKIKQLDDEIDEVLHQTGDEKERLRRYEQLLQRCMHFVTEQRKPFRLTIPLGEENLKNQDKEDLREKIVEAMPKDLKKDTKHLYDVLHALPNVTWDDTGLVTIDGTPLPHSNISDLISDCIRKRKRANAQAWEHFVATLAKSNFPIGHINNTAYRTRIRELRGEGVTPAIVKRLVRGKKKTQASRHNLKKKTLRSRLTPKNEGERHSWRAYNK